MTTAFTKGKFILAFSALALAALACGTNVPATPTQDTGLSATQTALAATAEAIANAPTDTPVPTATEVPPTPTITPTKDPFAGVIDFTGLVSGDVAYRTEFDKGEWEDGWDYFNFAFDGKSPDSKEFSVDMGNGALTLGLNDPWVEVYVFDKNVFVPRGVDVYVEAFTDNLGPTRDNNISVFCRVSDAGWYEFSISSSGFWFIWRYLESDNSYIFLTQGAYPGYNKDDTDHLLAGSCVGDTLTIYIDGKMPKYGQIKDSTLREGYVGVGAFAFDIPDVNVLFEYFEVRIP
ncbi:MAG: hypothetical protein HYZ26_11820 [Chloroflexi bacterium]|nr:hypothetical protein [Chloroflexota bacterium]